MMLRKVKKIKWSKKVTNVKVLERAGEKWTLINITLREKNKYIMDIC